MTASAASSSLAGSLGFLNQWWRVGGAAGVVFAVLFVVSIAVKGGPPAYDAEMSEIRAFFADDGDQYLVGDWITGVAVVLFFVPFAAALRGVLGAADRSGGMWPRAALAGAVLYTAIAATSAIAWGALALGETAELSDGSIRALMYVDVYSFANAPLGFGLMLIAASIAILQTGVLWRWLGYAGPVIAVAGVIGSLWVVGGDEEGVLGVLQFLSQVLGVLWVLAASVALILRSEAPGDA